MKVNLYNGTILHQSEDGVWAVSSGNLPAVVISQEEAVSALASAVRDLGHWCQVAKDILPEDLFDEVNEAFAAD